MLQKSILVLFFLISLNSYVFADENEKVEETFQQMIQAYNNENLKGFFRHVKENGFQKDFMDFYDDVKQDMIDNDMLNIDVWVDKITSDKNRKFLYVKWDKRYLTLTDNIEQTQIGQSFFLFDKTKKGKYKLIDFGGDVLFGNVK